MITTKLSGGLGNQMFQYATGYVTAQKKNEELILDISNYNNHSKRDTLRQFELLKFFNISYTKTIHIQTPFLIHFYQKIKNKLLPINPYEFNINVFKKNKLNGYFQNEKYFKKYRKDLSIEFTLKKQSNIFKETKNTIKFTESIAMHIRRGDYVTNSFANDHHGVLLFSYYEKAYETLTNNVKKSCTLFVFSDDISWCKEHVKFQSDITFVSCKELSSAEELILMSLCTHNIIANSTFSWWAAWLNQNRNKIVIAPKNWTKNVNSNDIIPASWIQI